MANTVAKLQKSIPTLTMQFSAGTWTQSTVGTRTRAVKTAGADGQTFITIPFTFERPYDQYGFRLQELYIPFNMDVAAPTVGWALSALNRHDFNNPTIGAGTAVGQTSFGSLFTISFQQGQTEVTNTNISATSQAMIITPTAAFWENESAALNRVEWAAQVSYTPAATTTVTIWPPQVRYDVTSA